MTRKKLIKTLLISSPIVFAVGFLHFSLVNNFKYDELGVCLLASLIPGAFVFGVLKIVDVFLGLSGVKYKVYKPYVIAGLITFFAMCIAIFVVIIDKNTVAGAFKKAGFEFCFHYVLSALSLCLFLWGVDDENTNSEDQILVGLIRRVSKKANHDNLPVSLRRFLEPEMYFDDNYGKELYFANEENLQKKAEEAAIEFINENNLVNETSSEWFLSRVDFNCKDSYDEPLTYHMNFIKRTVEKITINFIPLPDREHETESFKLVCSFDYNQNNADDPFELTSIEEV